MASNLVFLQIRVDTKLKARAAKVFQKMGLSTSDAIRLFLAQAVEDKAMPFQPTVAGIIPTVEVSKTAPQKADAKAEKTQKPGAASRRLKQKDRAPE